MLDDRYRQFLIDDICKFVRIPSRSSRTGGEEGVFQSLVEQEMRRAGARVRVFEADHIPEFRRHPLCCGPERDYAGRPTVIGELGPENEPALLILAHSDTVEVFEPKEWTFNPFLGEVRNGKILGLGSGDDKWGTASMLIIMRALQESERKLKKKLIFASTIDEENGVVNGTLLLTLAGIKAEAALYLDGYQMTAFIGNMGGSHLYLRPGDSVSDKQFASNARMLESACRQISERRSAMFNRPFYTDNATRNASVLLHRRECDKADRHMVILFYTLPGEKRADICGELETLVSAALGQDFSKYATSYREPWFEPVLIRDDLPLISYLSEALLEETGEKLKVTTISKQDSFVLTKYAGIPTVSFGPRDKISGRGAFHQPDECISTDEAWDGCRVAYGAICRWLEDST